MIDTAMLPSNARIWRNEVEKHGQIRYVVNTEHHIDHTAGNCFFPGTLIAHEGVREILRGPLERVKTLDLAEVDMARSMDLRAYILWEYGKWDVKGMASARGYEVRFPDITFSTRLTIHLGKHTFELMHLPGHTPNQIGVYVPEERVVFTGDNFAGGSQPSLAHCSPLEWIESLKKIMAWKWIVSSEATAMSAIRKRWPNLPHSFRVR
ncbi:MAG: MBL fold metallo-hydrolase [Chloroflexi bacterium]|nr:MBL fold metallo-hydrolase [Chloroflexota bacterium]